MTEPWICVYCGAAAEHREHVVPQARGGSDDPQNIVPACAPCNYSKSATLLWDWDPVRVAHAAAVSPKVAAVLARRDEIEVEVAAFQRRRRPARQAPVSAPGSVLNDASLMTIVNSAPAPSSAQMTELRALLPPVGQDEVIRLLVAAAPPVPEQNRREIAAILANPAGPE